MLAIIHLEVRLAFKSCARIHSIRRVERRTFTTFPPLRDWKRGPSAATEHYSASKRPASGTPAVVENSSESAEPRLSKGNDHELSGSSTTELVPRRPKPDSLQHPRRADVPARVLPKTQVSADLTLSPKERLRLEYETRRPPKPPEKPVFKERLLIYHGGLGYTNYIAMLRVSTMFAAAFGLVILAPAYYFYENAPWWTAPLIIFATTAPFFLVRFLARPFVSWIYLILPPYACQTPRAALEYSRNLPKHAMLQISFMRATALPGQVEVSMADLVPRKGKWPPTTFEWVGRRVDRGTWFRPNPTSFFVNKRSGTGKAARDTVPGVWENVYERIMGIEGPTRTKRSK